MTERIATNRLVDAVARPQRGHLLGQLNLKSCELLSPAVGELHARTLRDLDPSAVVEYPLVGEVRERVAERFGHSCERVLLTPGTDHAIQLICEAFVQPAGRLVIATPHFDAWTRACLRLGVEVDAESQPSGGPVGVGALIARMRAKGPCVVAVAQPDSFTGHAYRQDEIAALSSAAAEHGSLLVVDTCYLAFAESGEQTVSPLAGEGHALRVQSFSKSFGLAGARVGAVLGDESLIDHLARWNVEGMVSGPALALLAGALRAPWIFTAAYAEVAAARKLLSSGLTRLDPSCVARPSAANFVAFDAPEETAAWITSVLATAGIRIRSLNGLEGFAGGMRIATPSLAAVRSVLGALANGRAAVAGAEPERAEG
ncbi:aminotransferase class I/II-fold pyridoxal phosphate-dependent enzyme [Streptomyces sp. NPDC020192]|uniref:aminotransferase class I/II-fold pyridoxal phosphate-dependent enzyme n=1 Tax=Streptomyces sp. NPDC020192 TaxID=3365066 RepID=UPI00379556A6